MGKRIVDWSSVDWSKKNSVLARELGVCRQRVHQMRPADQPRTLQIKPEWHAVALTAYLSHESVASIANRLSKAPESIYRSLKKQGVSFQALSSAHIDWASQDWSQTGKTIAEKLGCSISCVDAARRRLGAPKSNSRLGWNSHNPERRILIEEAITKGDMTIREIAETFEVCITTVRRYARQLK